MFSGVVGLLSVLAVASAAQLRITDCNTSGQPSLGTIKRFDLSPQPVKFPGRVSWNVEAELLRNVTDVRMSLWLIKKTYFFDLTLPCIDNIGSCTYDRMCSFVHDMITDNWAGIGAIIGNQTVEKSGGAISAGDQCGNVLPAQKFHSRNSLDVPTLPSILSFIAEGDYTVRAELTDLTDQRTIVCAETDVTFEDASDSFWGRRRRRSLRRFTKRNP